MHHQSSLTRVTENLACIRYSRSRRNAYRAAAPTMRAGTTPLPCSRPSIAEPIIWQRGFVHRQSLAVDHQPRPKIVDLASGGRVFFVGLNVTRVKTQLVPLFIEIESTDFNIISMMEQACGRIVIILKYPCSLSSPSFSSSSSP